MKKVVKGKIYSIETAELLGKWSNGRYTTDPFYRSQSLYRTPHGYYFILKDNGARSRASLNEEDIKEEEGEKKIIPIDEKKAFRWARSRMTVKEYREAFGVGDEDIDMSVRQKMEFALTKETAGILRDISGKTGTAMSILVDEAVREKFDGKRIKNRRDD